MKKFFFTVSALAVCAFMALPVSAAEFVGNQTSGFSIPTSTEIREDVYAAAKQIDIAGAVNADANVAGETVAVGGSVAEDLIAAGQVVTIAGTVGQDARVAGQTITVSGTVHGDVVAFGETLTIAAGSVIDGDVLFFGKTLIVLGTVKGEVHVWSGTASFTGAKTGAITAHTTDFSLTGTTVTGDVTYFSNTEIHKDGVTTISGKVTRIPLPAPAARPVPKTAIDWGLLLMALTATAIAVWLFRSVASVAVLGAVARPWRNLFVGLAALIVIPIVSVILLITFIGIPLGLLLLLSYGVLLIIAKVLSGILVGALLAKMITKEYQVTYLWAFAGVALLVLLKIVPIVGWIPGVVTFLMMIGIVFRTAEHKLFRSEPDA